MATTETQMTEATQTSVVKTTLVEEEISEEELRARGLTPQCAFETDFPSNLLSGSMYVVVSEAENAGRPARIIDSNEAWLVDVYWRLSGQAVPLISGKWRVKVFMESLGKDSLDIEIPPYGFPVPTNPFSSYYHVRFYIPGNYVKVEPTDGTPYEINVVTALLANNGRPSPIIGFCSLDPILFFYEAIEVGP
jgi:hypothetical protein